MLSDCAFKMSRIQFLLLSIIYVTTSVHGKQRINQFHFHSKPILLIIVYLNDYFPNPYTVLYAFACLCVCVCAFESWLSRPCDVSIYENAGRKNLLHSLQHAIKHHAHQHRPITRSLAASQYTTKKNAVPFGNNPNHMNCISF